MTLLDFEMKRVDGYSAKISIVRSSLNGALNKHLTLKWPKRTVGETKWLLQWPLVLMS